MVLTGEEKKRLECSSAKQEIIKQLATKAEGPRQLAVGPLFLREFSDFITLFVYFIIVLYTYFVMLELYKVINI